MVERRLRSDISFNGSTEASWPHLEAEELRFRNSEAQVDFLFPDRSFRILQLCGLEMS